MTTHRRPRRTRHAGFKAKKRHTEDGASGEVLDQLRGFIHHNNLGPGSKLPSERDLSTEFGVSRPAVREAIKALAILDVLESRRGDGTYIKSLAALDAGWPAKPQFAPSSFDLIELLEVRKMFEPRAAALAAARADRRQLKELEKFLLAQERRPDDAGVLQRYDYLFHEAITRAAGNSVLSAVTRSLAPLLIRSRRITARTTPDVAKIVRQHRAIFNAIRSGDSELAEFAMKEHIQTVGLDLISDRKR